MVLFAQASQLVPTQMPANLNKQKKKRSNTASNKSSKVFERLGISWGNLGLRSTGLRRSKFAPSAASTRCPTGTRAGSIFRNVPGKQTLLGGSYP